jgi:hypothetical protein
MPARRLAYTAGVLLAPKPATPATSTAATVAIEARTTAFFIMM